MTLFTDRGRSVAESVFGTKNKLIKKPVFEKENAD